MTSVDGADAEPPAAWSEHVEVHWFLPLPEQIAIPEEPENPLSVSFPEEGEIPGDPVMVVLLTPHHRLYPWPTPDGTDASFAVMKEVLSPALASIAHEAATDRPLELAVTVMQAVVAYPPGELPDERRIEVGFNRALDAIAMVQRGYHAATKRPVTIIQREKLPPILPWARLRSAGNVIGKSESGVMIMHSVPPEMELAKPLTAEEWRRTQWAIGAELAPFLNYVDLRREAYGALRRGEYGTAAVLCATASEVFLETLLLHLVWSEGMAPEEAAALFEGRGLTARVKTEYHIRLGGQWTQTGTGPVATWFAKTANLRHRVVHAGYRPSFQESTESLDAMVGLEKFVMDKLSTPRLLKKYPATAMAVVSEAGLRRRKKSDAVIADLLGHSRDWMVDFVRWNAKVITLRNEQ